MAFSLLLVALIIGHLLADFYWQPMSWVNDRNSRHFKATKLYFHVLVHGVTSAIIISAWEYTYGWQQISSVVIATAVIMLSHYAIDIAKSYSSKGVVPFLLDQLAHIAVIIYLSVWLSDNTHFLDTLYSLVTNPNVLWVVCGYLIILSPSAVLDQFAGVGFLLAAKSVFRFGDLSASKDKKLTEYVMLGTLLSVSVTLFVGLMVKYLIH